ncbi:MAG: hypothetical protein ACO1TE_17775 [Prosthecobacter sp.]
MKTQLRILPLLALSALLSSCQGSSPSASGFSPSTMNITAGSVTMTGTRADGTPVSGSGRDFSEALRSATSAATTPGR